jgi:uncharacterized SAM-binding protein YcdF (DUF218 family)
MNLALHMTDLSHPGVQTAILIAIGLIWLCLRRYRIASVFGVLGVSWIILCATPAFSARLRQGLEAAYPIRQADDYPRADAIVVLGGGDPPDFIRDAANNQPSRAGFALELYRQARAPVILLSGSSGEALEMAHLLAAQGVPTSALRTEAYSGTTYQNATYSAPILRREHRRSILLVTSPLFMRRAAACFRQLGMEVIPAPTLDLNTRPLVSKSWWPQPAVLVKSQQSLHEYFGLLVYKARGWI